MSQHKDQVVVITGVSTGLGYNMAETFLKRGYTVYGSVRTQDDADKLQGVLGDRFIPLLFDVTDHPAIEKAAKLVEQAVGEKGIAALVNNAGIAVGGPLLHIDMEDIRYQFEVNVFGLIKTTQTFAPLLGARENHGSSPGKIINISSVSGKIGFPFIGPYVGSKHAVEGMSETLRRELMKYGIDVIVIGPGSVKTPIWYKDRSAGKWDHTPYAQHMKTFGDDLIKPAVERALDVQKIGDLVLKVFENSKPRTRYTIVAQKLKNWTLPRLLPVRLLDRIIARKLKMIK